MPRPRKEPGPRTIETNRTGSAKWTPDQPHALDMLDEELSLLRAQLPTEIEALLLAAHQTEQHLATLQQIEQQDDPTALFTAADLLASRLVSKRFANRKHAHHLQTLFAIRRRQRVLGRFKAIRAALDLVNGLLQEDDTLSEDALTTRQEKTAQHTEPEHPATDLQHEEQTFTQEELRLQHLDEPLTPIVGSATHSRQLLRDFEAKLPDLRSGLTTGNGWFEVFYVPKRRYKKEVTAYGFAWANHMDHGSPLPPDIEQAIDPRVAICIQQQAAFPPDLHDLVYDIIPVGPYAKYRWSKDKQTYTISLGLLNDYPPFPFTPDGF